MSTEGENELRNSDHTSEMDMFEDVEKAKIEESQEPYKKNMTMGGLLVNGLAKVKVGDSEEAKRYSVVQKSGVSGVGAKEA